MIVEYIRYELTTHRAADLVAAYKAAGAHLAAAPECLGYELSTCDEAPTTCILRIEWTSAEGHMSGFRNGPHFPPFLALVRPFVGEIAEMRHYTPVLVSPATKPQA
jgi:quinol monooxygenase YgiN